jgi:hypothetical protein
MAVKKKMLMHESAVFAAIAQSTLNEGGWRTDRHADLFELAEEYARTFLLAVSLRHRFTRR